MLRTRTVGIAIVGAAAVAVAALVFMGSSEAQKAAAAREQLAAAIKGSDFEKAADAVNDFSRLRGSTLSPAVTLEAIYPIGSTADYPLTSLNISGDFVRRRLFYSEVASFLAGGKATEEEKILAAFNWVVNNIWPLHTGNNLSGSVPEAIALAGTASPVDMCWLFCTICENLGIRAVLFNLRLKEAQEDISMVLVNSGGAGGLWYLFSPGSGLPLVKKDGGSVATVYDFFEGDARVPGSEPYEPQSIEYVKIFLTSESEMFLPAAGELEKLLKEIGINLLCSRAMRDLKAHGDSIFAVDKRNKAMVEKASLFLWKHPFHLESAAAASGSADITPVSDACVIAKFFMLAGRYTEALQVLEVQPGDKPVMELGAARLGSGDYEGTLAALKDFQGEEGPDSDTAAFIAGSALSALGRADEAAGSFRKISGLRAALGAFMAEKALTGKETRFTIGRK